MAAPTRIDWTDEENRHLLARKLQGYQVSQIADSLGRARSTVGQRIKALILQLPAHEQAQYAEKRPVPPGHPPTLAAEHSSAMIHGWTPEMDAKAIELRGLGWSYARIGAVVGKNQKCVNDRLKKLAEIGITKREPPKKRVSIPIECVDDIIKRPAGPIPANPDPPKSPRDPGYRTCLTCLANGRTKYFWSQSGAVRRCESCKRMFNICDGRGEGRSIDDRLELSLHL